MEDIEDGVSFNIDGNVADTVLSHEDHGTEFLREMCSSRAFRVAARERVSVNRSQDSFDAFCLVEMHHQLRMHWHRNLISNSFDAACFVLNMKDGGWNRIRSSLTGSRSWRRCIMTLNRTNMRIRLFHATKSLVEKRNAEAKQRRKIYSESQIDERLDLEYTQYELETLLSKNMLESFSLSPERDWRVYNLPPSQFFPRHVRASNGTITLKQSLKTSHGVMITDQSNKEDELSERPFVVCFENEKDRFRFLNLVRAFRYSGVDRHEVDTAYLVGQNVNTNKRVENDYLEIARRRISVTKKVVSHKNSTVNIFDE